MWIRALLTRYSMSEDVAVTLKYPRAGAALPPSAKYLQCTSNCRSKASWLSLEGRQQNLCVMLQMFTIKKQILLSVFLTHSMMSLTYSRAKKKREQLQPLCTVYFHCSHLWLEMIKPSVKTSRKNVCLFQKQLHGDKSVSIYIFLFFCLNDIRDNMDLWVNVLYSRDALWE